MAPHPYSSQKGFPFILSLVWAVIGMEQLSQKEILGCCHNDAIQQRPLSGLVSCLNGRLDDRSLNNSTFSRRGYTPVCSQVCRLRDISVAGT